MNSHLKKFIINILLGFIPISKIRKRLREKFLFYSSTHKINLKDKTINQLNNNKFIIISNGNKIFDSSIAGLKINFTGKNSTVVVHAPVKFINCSIRVGYNSTVEIFSSTFDISNLKISATNNSKIIIKENFSCRGCNIENHDESNLEVTIGEDCMFSYGIHIRVSDGHTIYNLDNNEIINKPQKGITIGNHVWIGMDVTILKNVSIPSNSIIGAESLINKSFCKENTIIAGIPAKIIKENINWSRKHTENFVAPKLAGSSM